MPTLKTATPPAVTCSPARAELRRLFLDIAEDIRRLDLADSGAKLLESLAYVLAVLADGSPSWTGPEAVGNVLAALSNAVDELEQANMRQEKHRLGVLAPALAGECVDVSGVIK